MIVATQQNIEPAMRIQSPIRRPSGMLSFQMIRIGKRAKLRSVKANMAGAFVS